MILHTSSSATLLERRIVIGNALLSICLFGVNCVDFVVNPEYLFRSY